MFVLFTIVHTTLFAGTSTCNQNPSTIVYSVGNITARIITDGPGFFPPTTFSASTAAVRRSYRLNFRASDPIRWSQNIVVFPAATELAIVDTGSFNIPHIKASDQASQLLANIKSAGIAPKEVRHVFLTHVDPDHVSGVIKLDGTAAFRNARVYVSRKDYFFWSDPPFPTPSSSVSNETAGTSPLFPSFQKHIQHHRSIHGAVYPMEPSSNFFFHFLPMRNAKAMVRTVFLRSIAPYISRITLVKTASRPSKTSATCPHPATIPATAPLESPPLTVSPSLSSVATPGSQRYATPIESSPFDSIYQQQQ